MMLLGLGDLLLTLLPHSLGMTALQYHLGSRKSLRLFPDFECDCLVRISSLGDMVFREVRYA